VSAAVAVGERKAAASQWFESLRDQICAAFEAIEDEHAGAPDRPAGRFIRKQWKRPTADASDGGGGTMAIMKGRVFEKVGVNVSTVYGQFEPQFAKEIPGAQDDPSYWASGISLVAHMHSPRVPTAHFNTRHIITRRSWFGGGGDLTPMIAAQRTPQHPNSVLFHAALRTPATRMGPITTTASRNGATSISSSSTGTNRAASAASSTITLKPIGTRISRSRATSGVRSSRPIRQSCARP
jgi:coproporphyrinogen III oxidase